MENLEKAVQTLSLDDIEFLVQNSDTYQKMVMLCSKVSNHSSKLSTLHDNITDNNTNEQSCLLRIPWNDVIFPLVFPYLSWKDLFCLRRVSRVARDMVEEYFASLTRIDLKQYRSRFTLSAFRLLTIDNQNLRVLNLSGCKWLSNEQLQAVIERNPNLTELDISSCFEVSNVCLQRLAINCRNLKSIVLKECHWVNAIAITHLAMNCANLENVDLTSCWEINDEAAIDLITRCKHLRRFSLSKIYGITDQVPFHLAHSSRKLEYFNISGCWRITDSGVR